MSNDFRAKLLIEDHPLIVLPQLAVALGINHAIVLQQIHYLIKAGHDSRNEYVHKDGKWWVYNTYANWKACYFPWLSESTIKNVMLDLETWGILETRQSVKHPSDRTKWYTIRYDGLDTMRQKLSDGTWDKNCPINGQRLSHDLSKTPYLEETPIAPQSVAEETPNMVVIPTNGSLTTHNNLLTTLPRASLIRLSERAAMNVLTPEESVYWEKYGEQIDTIIGAEIQDRTQPLAFPSTPNERNDMRDIVDPLMVSQPISEHPDNFDWNDLCSAIDAGKSQSSVSYKSSQPENCPLPGTCEKGATCTPETCVMPDVPKPTSPIVADLKSTQMDISEFVRDVAAPKSKAKGKRNILDWPTQVAQLKPEIVAIMDVLSDCYFHTSTLALETSARGRVLRVAKTLATDNRDAESVRWFFEAWLPRQGWGVSSLEVSIKWLGRALQQRIPKQNQSDTVFHSQVDETEFPPMPLD